MHFEDESVVWVLHFDGSFAHGRMGYGFHIEDEHGNPIARGGGPLGAYLSGGVQWATNNVAEFEALIHGLRWVSAAKWVRVERLDVRGDSQLVCEVANGNWRTHKPHLTDLAATCHALVSKLQADGTAVRIGWVPREQNAQADQLAEA